MKIEQNKVVVMHYAVMDNEENTIDSSYDSQPLAFIQGTGYLIPGLESQLDGKIAGDTFTVTVAAKDAYGERNDNLVQTLPHDLFDGMEVDLGMQFRASTDDGEQTVIVVGIDDEDGITVDGNHPLAGMDLTFDVEVIEVRDATAEELVHGHVHGQGGCGHDHDHDHDHHHDDEDDGHNGCCGGGCH